MKFLLDTHVWLWSLLEPTKVNALTQSLLLDPNNIFFLSPISVWETLIGERKSVSKSVLIQ
jgi:PIN domain nuclease of toxin-antitoxin system